MVNRTQATVLDRELRSKGTRLSVYRDKARSVYATEEGKNALVKLMITGGFFSKMPVNEGDVAIHNLVSGILEDCGFFDEQNLRKIVDHLYTLPLVDKDLEF